MDDKKPAHLGRWKELQPTVYRREKFSQQESSRWTKRPNDLLKSALNSSKDASNEAKLKK